jgi:TonB family protein
MAPVVRPALLAGVILMMALPAIARWRTDVPVKELVPAAPAGVPLFTAEVAPPVAEEVRTPEYPAELRQAGITGTVSLSFCVMKDGKVDHIAVTRSLGPTADELVVRAVRAWRFKPASRDGNPEPSRVQVDVTFADDSIALSARFRGAEIALPAPTPAARANHHGKRREPVLVDREGSMLPSPWLATSSRD